MIDLLIIASEDDVDASSDDTPPVITSSASVDAEESVPLAHTLTADEGVTWEITGGADASLFEISGSTLRFAGNTTHTIASPADSDTNNIYIVEVTAEDDHGNQSDPQEISVYVTDADGWFTVWAAGTLTLSNSFGGMNSRHKIPKTVLVADGTNKVRVTFTAGSSNALDISNASIGRRASGASFDGSEVNLQFTGSEGVTISTGNSVVSDEALLAFTAGVDDLLVAIQHAGTSHMQGVSGLGVGLNAAVNFSKTTGSDETLTTSVTIGAGEYGIYGSDGQLYGVTKIEVKQ